MTRSDIKSEALRLADELEMWTLGEPAAAELRRLHQFAEDQIGRATTAEAALQMTKVTHALKIAAVEAQRDALLEALRIAEAALSDIGDADREPGDDVAWCEARAAEAIPQARAAIEAAEGEKQ